MVAIAISTFLILGIEVPLARMPVAPGRNIALLVEVADDTCYLVVDLEDAARVDGASRWKQDKLLRRKLTAPVAAPMLLEKYSMAR